MACLFCVTFLFNIVNNNNNNKTLYFTLSLLWILHVLMVIAINDAYYMQVTLN